MHNQLFCMFKDYLVFLRNFFYDQIICAPERGAERSEIFESGPERSTSKVLRSAERGEIFEDRSERSTFFLPSHSSACY